MVVIIVIIILTCFFILNTTVGIAILQNRTSLTVLAHDLQSGLIGKKIAIITSYQDTWKVVISTPKRVKTTRHKNFFKSLMNF